MDCTLLNFQSTQLIASRRWFRLLFGREFALESLLSLWDCIFADDVLEFGLADWIALALLLSIEDKGTNSNFSLFCC